MALQESAEEGIVIGEIWERCQAFGIDDGQLATATGRDPKIIGAIDLYRGKKGRHFFPTLDQHLKVFRSYLKLQDVRIPGYEIGDRRPNVILSREG